MALARKKVTPSPSAARAVRAEAAWLAAVDPATRPQPAPRGEAEAQPVDVMEGVQRIEHGAFALRLLRDGARRKAKAPVRKVRELQK